MAIDKTQEVLDQNTLLRQDYSMDSLTLEQKACNADTFRHIERVRNLLNLVIKELISRGEVHDQSKLESPEVEYFAEYTPKLAACTYGSDEYKSYLAAIKPALDHHYANNRHHPEWHKNGIDDMNLIDIIEMLCDWKAASERHNNGNIQKSPFRKNDGDMLEYYEDLVAAFNGDRFLLKELM